MTDITNGGDKTADISKATADAKARIKAIMTSKEAEGNEEQAEHLAYETEMTAEAAVAILAKAVKAQETVEETPEAYAAKRIAAAGLNAPGGGRPGAKGDRAVLAAAVDRSNKRR